MEAKYYEELLDTFSNIFNSINGHSFLVQRESVLLSNFKNITSSFSDIDALYFIFTFRFCILDWTVFFSF